VKRALIALSLVVVALPAVATAAPRDTKVMPTFTLGVGMGPSEEDVYFHSWIGASWHRIPSGVTAPFVAGGIELDIRDRAFVDGCCGTVLETWATVRGGLGFYAKDLNIPAVAVYGIVGYLPSWTETGKSYRVGMGLSIPIGIGLAQGGIPNLVELILDENDRDTIAAIRLGWGI
jgi:hypothetical protein